MDRDSSPGQNRDHLDAEKEPGRVDAEREDKAADRDATEDLGRGQALYAMDDSTTGADAKVSEDGGYRPGVRARRHPRAKVTAAQRAWAFNEAVGRSGSTKRESFIWR